jgi:methylenetetrahydrofolate reductase (NADPH)
MPTISFEFFPPRTPKAAANLFEAAKKLTTQKPAFMTVTYGAGGSSRSWTLETATTLQDLTGVPMATHLTCINLYKKALIGVADTFWDNGIKHIVALRGDVPPEDRPLDYGDHNYFHYASDLVEALKTTHPFEISVAAYPEKHPDAPSLEADIDALKKKCDAGADRAITQFFFDNDVFFRFRDKVAAAGIKTPIVPGILPIVDFTKMKNFAARCQSSVPEWVHSAFVGLENDPDGAHKAAVDLFAKQLQGLSDAGEPHIHIYTLNRAEILLEAMK